MTMCRRFVDKSLTPAVTVFLVSFALFAVTAAPAGAQRTYDRLPIVKEGTTVRISPHVYVIPDENARGYPMSASSSAAAQPWWSIPAWD